MTNEQNAKTVFSRIGFSILSISLINVFLSVIILGIGERFSPGISSDNNFKVMVSSITMYVVAMPFAYFCIRNLPTTEIAERKISVGQEITIMLSAYAGGICASFIIVAIGRYISRLTGHALVNPVQNALVGANAFTLICAVVLAPIMEELVFRKLLIDRIIGYGEGVAMVVSGVFFGLMHGNLQQAFYATFLGMLFAYVYIRTGRIRYTIIAHAFVNAIGSVLAVVMGRVDLEKVEELTGPGGNVAEYNSYVNQHLLDFALVGLVFIIIAAIVIAGIVLMIVNMKHFHIDSKDGDLPKGTRLNTVVGNYGVICYIIYFVVMIIMMLYVISLAGSLLNLVK